MSTYKFLVIEAYETNNFTSTEKEDKIKLRINVSKIFMYSKLSFPVSAYGIKFINKSFNTIKLFFDSAEERDNVLFKLDSITGIAGTTRINS